MVYRAMVEVTTLVESAGQSVIVAAQLVTVNSLVVKTVEVVNDEALAEDVTELVTGEDPEGPAEVVAPEELDMFTAELTGELAGKLPLTPTEEVCRGVDWTAELRVAEPVSVTGQTVVEIALVDVTTLVESAGQSVIVAAQLVMVNSSVVHTVEVVH